MMSEQIKSLKYLDGERIFLRRITDTDVDYFLKAVSDPKIRRLTGTTSFFTKPQIEQAIEKWSLDDSRIDLVICLKSDFKVIGDLAIMDVDYRERKGSFRIAIADEAYMSNGYGSEALHLIIPYMFNTLNLRKININVYAYNERAIKTYEKLGFLREGVIREDLYFDGEYHDNILMGLFKHEYIPR